MHSACLSCLSRLTSVSKAANTASMPKKARPALVEVSTCTRRRAVNGACAGKAHCYLASDHSVALKP